MTSSRASRAQPSELDMVRSAYLRLLKARGTRPYQEVPLLGRTIDLVYVRGSLLTSVEFKLSNWRRAIAQARDHQLAADFSYICIPPRSLPGPMRIALEDTGVGLLFYSPTKAWPFEKVVPAKRSREKWAQGRAWMLAYMRGMATERS